MRSVNRRSLLRIKKDIKLNDNYGLTFTNEGFRSPNVNVQEININNTNGFDFSNHFTLEFRHRLNSLDGSYPYLFHVLFTDGGELLIRYQNSTTLRVSWRYALPSSFQPINSTISIGQFNHIVFAFQQGLSARLYINNSKNEVLSNVTLGGTNIIDTIKMYGFNGSNVWNVNGYATGIRFFQDYAASDSDVISLYNSNNKKMQNIPSNMIPFLLRDFPLNQEEGREVQEIASGNTEQLENVDGWQNTDVLSGGGVWQDVSGLT